MRVAHRRALRLQLRRRDLTAGEPLLIALAIARFQGADLRVGDSLGLLGSRGSHRGKNTPNHPFPSQKGVLLVQFETEVGGQDEPERPLVLAARRGHRLGQGGEHLFAEEPLEELLLVGLAESLEGVTFSPSKGFQHCPRVMFNESQMGHGLLRGWEGLGDG